MIADPGPDRLASGTGEVLGVERRVDLAELDERVRAQDGPRGVGVAGGLAPRQRAEGGDRALDLRHDVVVVRVEPLRHLPGLAVGRAAGQVGEHVEGVGIQAGGLVLRRDPEHQRGLEDLVIEEVVVNGGADGVALLVEVRLPQLGDAGGECIGIHASRPRTLQRALELAIGTDAWVAGEPGVNIHGRTS